MKNISIIELQEDQLDNINAAGAGRVFKKIGKTIARIGISLAKDTIDTVDKGADLVKQGGKALIKKCS